jgi:hypothetical protein
VKREAVGHTKIKRLCRRLNIPLYQAVGILELLWHTTARQTPRGDIGKLSDEDIAIAIDYHGDEHLLIEALIETGWLDRNEEYGLVVHDWPDHAEDGVHLKIARAKEFFIRSDRDGSVLEQAPKFMRLGGRERDLAAQFYEGRTKGDVRTDRSNVRTDRPSVRTDRVGGAEIQQSVRGPRLDPALTPPLEALEQTAANDARELSHLAAADFPKTAALLVTKFPTIDSAMVSRIIQASCQAWCSVDNPKIPEPGDDVYAAAVEAAKNGKQTSAALFLRTVPTVISNWAQSGRPVSPGAVDPSKISPYNPLKFKKGISQT